MGDLIHRYNRRKLATKYIVIISILIIISIINIVLLFLIPNNTETVGETTIITSNENGASVVHFEGIESDFIYWMIAFIPLNLGLSLIAYNIYHKKDYVEIYENGIKGMCGNKNYTYKYNELSNSSTFKNSKIIIQDKNNKKVISLFCLENDYQVSEIIMDKISNTK